jgi:hypothetical protein
MIKKKIWMVDRVWWDAELGQTVGDMGFTFCERDDTRTDDLEKLRKDLSEWREDEFQGSFAIYELIEIIAELEDDDECLACAEVDWDSSKVIEAFVCATRERAADADLSKYPKLHYYGD